MKIVVTREKLSRFLPDSGNVHREDLPPVKARVSRLCCPPDGSGNV